MRKLLDANDRRRMAQSCLELRPRLSYERHLNQLEGLYQQVRHGHAPQPVGSVTPRPG
jgi:hypothetical protein